MLFMDDIKLLVFPKQVDTSFSISYAICLFTFIFELVATSWSKSTFERFYPPKYNGYIFSFFWWLDLIALLTLFPDVHFIASGLGLYHINLHLNYVIIRLNVTILLYRN